MQRALVGLVVLIALASGGAASAADVAVLMPGKGGIVLGDFLARNEARFHAAGIRTVVTTSPSTAAETVATEAAQGHKVVMVGMSLGTEGVASALASGAHPAGVVFVSGMYPRVIATLGTPEKLPPTLLVHHRHDSCGSAYASDFVGWAHGKARLQWIDTSGQPSASVCDAHGAHGFYNNDGPAISAVIGFVRSR